MAAARIAAGRSLTVLWIAAFGDWLTFLAVPLPYATSAIVAETDMRHIELPHGDADEILPLASDHLAVRHVLSQVLANPAANDLSKAALISLDFEDHGLRC